MPDRKFYDTFKARLPHLSIQSCPNPRGGDPLGFISLKKVLRLNKLLVCQKTVDVVTSVCDRV
jgi:hypothetical protein